MEASECAARDTIVEIARTQAAFLAGFEVASRRAALRESLMDHSSHDSMYDNQRLMMMMMQEERQEQQAWLQRSRDETHYRHGSWLRDCVAQETTDRDVVSSMESQQYSFIMQQRAYEVREVREGMERRRLAEEVLEKRANDILLPKGGDAEVRGWLETLGLSHYAEAFEAAEVTLATIPSLTAADLTTIGVHTVGARCRILSASRSLKNSASATVADIPPRGRDTEAPTSPYPSMDTKESLGKEDYELTARYMTLSEGLHTEKKMQWAAAWRKASALDLQTQVWLAQEAAQQQQQSEVMTLSPVVMNSPPDPTRTQKVSPGALPPLTLADTTHHRQQVLYYLQKCMPFVSKEY